MLLKVKLLPGGKLPKRAKEGDVGYDLFSPIDITINPLDRVMIKLAIATEFDLGYVGLLEDRSGMGSKGIHRFAGVIDPTYRDEWGVVLYNSTSKRFDIKAGDRIVQVLFIRVEEPEVVSVEELDESTSRGGGWGSTDLVALLAKIGYVVPGATLASWTPAERQDVWNYCLARTSMTNLNWEKPAILLGLPIEASIELASVNKQVAL